MEKAGVLRRWLFLYGFQNRCHTRFQVVGRGVVIHHKPDRQGASCAVLKCLLKCLSRTTQGDAMRPCAIVVQHHQYDKPNQSLNTELF
ncbi:MAG TPA: hypothetical protein DIW24_09335 [Bacteroidetes bacterium]|nr:hypothetical protein [Bacteroidota bacterium]